MEGLMRGIPGHKMDLDEVRRHWERSGESMPAGSVTPTSRDPFLARLERESIVTHIKPTDAVLEIGCGDGTHSIEYARHAASFIGTDVASSLIGRAQERAVNARIANAQFLVRSALELDRSLLPDGVDVVISQRCLINLTEWELQKEAIRRVHALLRPGGLFLLTEGFQEPLEELNRVRVAVGLDEIAVVPYNLNLRRAEFDALVSELFTTVSTSQYGLYLFLSRVIHPLAVAPAPPAHDGHLNEVAFQTTRVVDAPDFQRYSYDLFYALRKR